MDLVSFLLLWRTQSGYHILGLVGFLFVLGKAWKIKPGKGIFLSPRDFLFLIGALGFVGATGEIFFNLWFPFYYGLSVRFLVDPTWIPILAFLILGLLAGIQNTIDRKDLLIMIGVQSFVMASWMAFGFPLSANVNGGSQPDNLIGNFFEILFYVVWTANWTRFMGKPLTNTYKSIITT